MQTITEIHIKAALDNEFRRFALIPPTFDNLHSTLRTLFHIETNFSVKFQDDEKDWVLISTNEELLYAVELAGTPLRLQLKPLITKVLHDSATVEGPDSFRRCHWGRGRGRGCRGRVEKGERPQLSKEERMTLKSSRLTTRISALETKLNSGELPPERERVLRWRLLQLKGKLAFFTETESADQTTTPSEDCRDHRRTKFGERFASRPRFSPEICAQFHQAKLDLQAARASGNPEQVQAALAAFQSAKQRKFEARNLWKAAKQGEEINPEAPGTSSL